MIKVTFEIPLFLCYFAYFVVVELPSESDNSMISTNARELDREFDWGGTSAIR